MLASVITFLIYVCILALVVYVVFWVVETLGIPLPPQVKNIIWLIVGLLVLLWIVQLLLPSLGGGGFHLPHL